MGPEQDISVLENELKSIRWDGTGVGYGVRGSRRQDLTIRLEGMWMIHDGNEYRQAAKCTHLRYS
jgi:hypothetical protein